MSVDDAALDAVSAAVERVQEHMALEELEMTRAAMEQLAALEAGDITAATIAVSLELSLDQTRSSAVARPGGAPRSRPTDPVGRSAAAPEAARESVSDWTAPAPAATRDDAADDVAGDMTDMAGDVADDVSGVVAGEDASAHSSFAAISDRWVTALPKRERAKLEPALAAAASPEARRALLAASARADTTKVRAKARAELLAAL